MRHIRNITAILLLIPLLAACFDGENGPTSEQVQKSFMLNKMSAEKLEIYTINSTEIVISDNIGSEIEPLYHARFRMKGALAQSLFKRHQTLFDRALIEQTAPKGTAFEITGTYKAKMRGDGWEFDFSGITQSPDFGGKARVSWGENALIATSPEATDLRQRAKTERLAREAAEAERLAQIVAENRAKAKAEKQRLAALEKARIARVTALRSAISGLWIAKDPFTKDGSFYELNHGFKLEIPSGSGLQGIAQITGFKRNNPSISTTFEAVFKIDKSGEFWTLKENVRAVSIDGNRRYPYNNYYVQWRAETSGAASRLNYSDNRGKYQAKLVKINITKSTQKKATLRTELAGIWQSTTPLTQNGNTYTRDGQSMGVRLDFSQKNTAEGTAKGRFYIDGDLDTFLTFNLRYTLDEAGELTWLYTPNDVEFEAMNWQLGGLPWRFEVNGGTGALSIKGNSDWYFPLKKLTEYQVHQIKLSEEIKRKEAARRTRLIAEFGARETAPQRHLSAFNLPYDSRSFVNVVVTGATDFGDEQFIPVYGGNPYGGRSQIGLTVVVAKLLAPGETGIVQLRRVSRDGHLKSRPFVKSMGEIYRTREARGAGYKLTLLAKL